MAIVEFFVIFAGFCGGDVKVRGGDVYAGREGRVREVVVDEVADLPEDNIIHGFVGATSRRPITCKYFVSLERQGRGDPAPTNSFPSKSLPRDRCGQSSLPPSVRRLFR